VRGARRRGWPLLLLLPVLLAAQGQCVARLHAPDDPLVDGDWALIPGGNLFELQPGVTRLVAGPDARLGTDDDALAPPAIGDVDLVLRTGMTDFAGPFPDPAPLRGSMPEAVAEPFGDGVPIAFVVAASDGAPIPATGTPVVSPSLEGMPVLVVAFADLDGDGFVGVTNLDGDPLDDGLEEAELEPVGRRFALMSGGRASGFLHIAVGGPAAAPVSVVLTAAAFLGPFDAAFFGGAVPTGPAVMTRFPFPPETDPDRVVDGGLPGPGDPDTLIGIEIRDQFTPDPEKHILGEAFTLPTDGSEVSVDVVLAGSGWPVRFGLGRLPQGPEPEPPANGLLRPGLDAAGQPVLYEILYSVPVEPGSEPEIRVLTVLPLDRLGNVADPVLNSTVTLHAEGRVRILSPDLDADASQETLVINDARGRDIQLDLLGPGGTGADALLLEGAASLGSIPFELP